MVYKPIIIVGGEPNSIFLEIFFKSLNYKKFKSPIVLIASHSLIKLQMEKLKIQRKVRLIDLLKLKKSQLNNKMINLINVKFDQKKPFDKISSKSNDYIKKSFDVALKILNQKITNKLINGPISKKFFLKKKYLGITEYLAHRTNTKNFAMLIYNKDLSVCPLTTHLPLKKVSKNINKNMIKYKIKLIDKFYRTYFNKKPKMVITGLNPHCESIDSFNEDEKIIKPAVKSLIKSNYNIVGPVAADTIFLKKNRTNYNVIIGLYHDQVLTPIKTLFEYDAVNITLGLPFTRISPDHGPNEKMLGKNKSSPLSLIKALTFLDTYK
ncbi:4-hydroxythreonine-4-phosphate dehydrogenase PdxA [Candidatus Pelagibacter sp.]|nr:4-hydroxythreonine-4-phosphate dehydrogenase PdxA [Candidatus Pelagibacter sp.]